jgi:hypothetical protein
MSASKPATVLEVAHKITPNYTIKKHQCFWYSLIVFLIARGETRGKESNDKFINHCGKLWGRAPEHSTGDDESVELDDYNKAWRVFKVSCH